MKYTSKIILPAIIISLFFVSGSSIHAQNVPDQECVQLTRNFGLGARDSNTGGEVTKLQNYLISSGYMNPFATGYFGQTTKRALAAFQAAKAISPANGYLGPVTRAKIVDLTCNSPSPSPIYTCSGQTNCIQGFKLPLRSVADNQTVTLDGAFHATTSSYAFDQIPTGSHTVSVTVPAGWFVGYTACVNSVTCHSNNPTPGNSLSINFCPATGPCPVVVSPGLNVPASSYVDLYWHFNQLSTSSYPHIDSINPTSGPVGTYVTLGGTSLDGSSLYIDGQIANSSVVSQNAAYMIFTVPSLLTGSHAIRVQNNNNISNTVGFIVTTPAPPPGPPSISSMTPLSGPVGTHVTINGTRFTPTANLIRFGGVTGVGNVSSTNGGTRLEFDVPQSAPATYTVTVVNANGTSNSKSFRLTPLPPGGSNGSEYICTRNCNQTSSILNALNEVLARMSVVGQTADVANALDWVLGNLREAVGGSR